jgi:chitinase
LPRSNAEVFNDSIAIASWSYDKISKTMISYDTPQIAVEKAGYIKRAGLGGAMWWETSGDRPCSSGQSSIDLIVESLGGQDGKNMEKSQNCLDYPESRYGNLRDGMPNE